MKTDRDKFLTPEQCSQLITCVRASGNRRDYMLLLLAMNLGARVGEVVRLRKEDILPSEGHVRMPTLKRLSPAERQAKGAAKRLGLHWAKKRLSRGELPILYIEVAVDKPIFKEIERYVRELGDGSWLFPGKNGLHLAGRQAERIFKRWSTSLGFSPRASFHCLRHSRGVDLREKGCDYPEIQEQLRHQSASSTMVYQHLLPSRRNQLAKKAGTLGMSSSHADVVICQSATSRHRET